MAKTTKSQSGKYLDRISLSKEEQDKQNASFLNEEAELSLSNQILSQKRAISATQREIDSHKSSTRFDAATIVSLMQKKEDIENGLEKLNDLKYELF